MPGLAPLRDRFSASAAAAAGAALLVLAGGPVGPPQRTALVPYVVAGDAIAKSLTGAPGNAASGRAIVTSAQRGLCLLCHSGPFPENRFQGTIGPDLAGVGTRLSAGQLRLRIVDPGRIDRDTIMPAFYRVDALHRVAGAYRGKPVLTAAEVEDVVAFLMTLK